MNCSPERSALRPRLLAGCEGRGKTLPPAGEILAPNYSIGHRIRDGFRPRPASDCWQETDVVVIGGGISGLAAAWRLRRERLERFVVLELESAAGGTSRSGKSSLTAYPWGAHYVPVPMPENRSLIAILREMGVIERLDPDGEPVVAEQYLCRDPGERVFIDGTWHEGLYPSEGATASELDELRQFRAEITRWVAWRDGKGRRAFAIPVSRSSDEPEVTSLDSISMSEWVRRRGWSSPRLRWLIDYSCRDDYGATSARPAHGPACFISRREFAERAMKLSPSSLGPKEMAESYNTWPQPPGSSYVADWRSSTSQ